MSRHGIKVVPLDRDARIRRTVRKLAKDLAEDGTKHLTFVVEGEDCWTIRSTRTDDRDVATVLLKAAHVKMDLSK